MSLTIEDTRLTPRQQRFVTAFLGEAAGNATEAARIAGYGHQGTTRAVMRQLGSQVLMAADVAAVIRGVARAIIPETTIVDRLAAYVMRDDIPPIERNAWVRACELLPRYHGALDVTVQHTSTERRELTVRTITVPLTIDGQAGQGSSRQE